MGTNTSILHLALRADWDEALIEGEYRTSTRGLTLEEVGFIHASFPDQVAATAGRFYGDALDDLLVLGLDGDAIAAAGVDVRHEDVGIGELFPHIYGALDPGWVRSVVSYRDWAESPRDAAK
ncbi:MAG TPA: DUF952 domain-containing protein [Candidatus Corynebacterium avicola]|uniref:DUF952 domain-containing protein n=1 Tax=Candidatus Corynebacterium avicola TaxID=2838527 RepID=A0A9D1RMA4_9CORY|nr:DUF952 domain-containing protein [Candidatus Corynebacterium avicola]